MPVDLDHAPFDELAPSDRKKYIDRACAAIAARLYNAEANLALQHRLRAEYKQKRDADQAASIRSKYDDLTSRDPATVAGRLHLFATWATCHLYDADRNVFIPPHVDPERLVHQAAIRELKGFRADLHINVTAIVGDDDAISKLQAIHNLPATVKVRLDDGQAAFIYSHKGQVPRFANDGPGYSFRWQLWIGADVTIEAVNLDTGTATLPRLPTYFENFFNDYFRAPDSIFKLLEQPHG